MRIDESRSDTPAPHNQDSPARCENGELIRILAKGLESRGLEYRLVTYPDDECQDEHVEEIVVTNPRARERGEIRVGDDGSVTWEYFGKLDQDGAGRLLDEITNALRASGLPVRRRQQS